VPGMSDSPTALDLVVAAVDQASEAVIVADLLGVITYANGAAARLTGAAADQMQGRHFVNLIRNPDTVGDIERIFTRVASGQNWYGPRTARGPGGSTLNLELAVAPVRNHAGEITHCVAVVRDLTRHGETAGVLAPELETQSVIGASLARLRPGDPIGLLATDIASALLILRDVDFGRIIAFGPGDQAHVVADESRGAALPTQRRVPAARARYLRARAAQGAWVETWAPRREYGRYGRELEAAGIRAVGFAPIRHMGQPVGVMAIGTLSPRGSDALERHLSALSHFGALASGILGPALGARQHEATIRAEIEFLIREHAFAPVFQPIVRLADGEPIAYEALTRFSDGSPPDRRFADAEFIGLGDELQSATMRAALEAAQSLPTGVALSLNVSPRFVLNTKSMLEVLRGSNRPIVLEITEREPIDDYPALRQAIAGLGVTQRWAVDDAGAGYASLRHIIELKPDYVKLDRGLVSGLNVDPVRQGLVAGMLHFAASIDIQIIAEGVETEAERLGLAELGVKYGQGYLFGRPKPAGLD
jgi:PAS domain S-box-containing protein